MDIKGFGTAYIEELIHQDYLHDIADIYGLYEYRDELIEKGILGKEKNTDKLLGVIEASKENDAYRLQDWAYRGLAKQRQNRFWTILVRSMR